MIKTGRRDFLKMAGLFGALLVAKPFFGKPTPKILRKKNRRLNTGRSERGLRQ